jgi:uncharacterized protein YjiS (DUF1127 family)
MATGIATANLVSNLCAPVSPSREGGQFLRLLLKVEAWLDRRASGRALNRLDDRALSDIGLSRADVERFEASLSIQSRPPMLVGRL